MCIWLELMRKKCGVGKRFFWNWKRGIKTKTRISNIDMNNVMTMINNTKINNYNNSNKNNNNNSHNNSLTTTKSLNNKNLKNKEYYSYNS